ncbi:uncharacterized protein LOC143290274 [Babylonia areolata]|uniref:uncharacterized protein LOC143290274 n=1 Tax=Babylonia areolata TaxID=304850 RepID=UPI003FD05522
MVFRKVVWIWVFTTLAAATAGLQSPAPESPDSADPRLLTRLEEVEGGLADLKAQCHREVHALTQNLRALQAAVLRVQRDREEMRQELEGLRGLLTPAQSLSAEGTHSSNPPQFGDRNPARHLNDPDPFHTSLSGPLQGVQQDQDPSLHVQSPRADPSLHVQTPRADDGGPLGVVVDHIAQRTEQLTAEVQALKTSDAQQNQAIQAARGSTFVRWGSSSCAGTSELVYSGLLGGSWYDHAGAASNPLCLSLSPRLLETKAGVSYALLYGGEYETSDSHQNKNPLCAVCRSPEPTTIMVPGADGCSSGWTLQYAGRLMAGYHAHHGATQFICVDDKMESEIGSQNNEEGRLLYYVQTQCGSLACPPYENNKLVTCAVCSK